MLSRQRSLPPSAAHPRMLVDAAGRARGQYHGEGPYPAQPGRHRRRLAGSHERAGDSLFATTARSTVAAILGCQNYDFLPQDQYDVWKDLILNFNPNMFADATPTQ